MEANSVSTDELAPTAEQTGQQPDTERPIEPWPITAARQAILRCISHNPSPPEEKVPYKYRAPEDFTDCEVSSELALSGAMKVTFH